MKKVINKIVIFLMMFFIYFVSFSQQKPIDSLYAEFKTQKNDSLKINTFIEILENLYDNSSDTLLDFYKKHQKIIEEKATFLQKYNTNSTLGYYCTIASKYKIGLSKFEENIKLSILNKDSLRLASSYGNVGNSNFYIGNTKNAIQYYKKALYIFEEKNNTVGLASLYGVLGNVYLKLQKNETALESYIKSKQYFEINKSEFGVATCNMNIGIVYKNMNENKKGLTFFNEAEKTYYKIQYNTGLAEVYGNKGAIYFQLKKYEKALNYHKKALDVFIKNNSKRSIIIVLDDISKCYIEMNKYNKAIGYSLYALDSIKKYSFNNLSSEIYYNLYTINKKTHNYKTALNYFELYKKINDSLFNKEKENNIEKLLTEFETKQKEKEIVILNKDKKLKIETINHQKNLLIFFISAFIIIFLLSVLLFKMFLFKKKANASLRLQKKEIETQKDEIEVQNELVKNQNKSIKDSILYASYIQEAILTPKQVINQVLPSNFILFKPKDVVSGDFYWLKKIDNIVYYAIADCTGHGVPGAFMSMLGISLLNEIIQKGNNIHPNEILEELRNKVKISLRQTGKENESQDGMDIAICAIDTKKMVLEYSGAFNPLYIVRKGNFIEIEATKNPIGIYFREKAFENHIFNLQKEDVLYTFSDGYADQFGGEKNKKFKIENMKNLFVEIYNKPMDEQVVILNNTITKWQGETNQTDDILLFGVRI